MSKFFFTTSILLALMIGATGPAPVAHAGENICSAYGPGTGCMTSSGESGVCDDSNVCAAGAKTVDTSAGGKGVENTRAAEEASKASAGATVTPGANTPTNYLDGDKDNAAYNGVMQKILVLFAWLVGVAAITLDNAVYYCVVTMGGYIGKLSAIGVAWRILRDLGNIMIIFGFLAIGISIILNTEKLGYGKKMLPMLLVGAVFLNFSLFFAEAIIDTGNLFATQFYTQINGGTPAGKKNFDFTASGLGLQDGISNKLMGQLGMQTLYGNAISNKQLLSDTSPWLVGFMGIILFLVTAFVMFSLAFILIARFVALIFVIILAPIGFAGLAIPQLQKKASQWWDTLFHQTVTAPILLLLLYIALAVITDVQFLTGFGTNANWTGFIPGADGKTNITGFAGVILSFIVAMGLLLLVVVQAKRLSAFGADWGTKMGGRLSFGLTAWGVNRTTGRVAYHLARVARQNKKFNKFDAWTGRVASRTLDRTATGTFDVRGTGLLKSIPGATIEAGEVKKDGFVGARTRSMKDHEEEVKRIETAHKDAFEPETVEKEKIEKTKKTHEDVTKVVNIAQEAKNTAQTEHDTAETTLQQHTDEVARLKKIDEDNKKKGIGFDQKLSNDIKTAEANLAVSDATFKAKLKELDTKREDLKRASSAQIKAKEKMKEAEKAPAERLSKAIEASKIAYAEGIDHLLPIGWAAYGPGTSAASKKIIKDAKNKETDDQKIIKALKALNKREAEEEAKNAAAAAGGTPPAPTPGAHP